MQNTSSNNRNFPSISISSKTGVPTLYRDNKPWFGWGGQRPIVGKNRSIFEHLKECGSRQVHLDATCGEDIYHPELRFWHGPGEYDGTFQDSYFRHITEACPEALVQLRISVGAPEWWMDQHPDHLQIYSDGSDHRELQRAGMRRVPSLASPLWRKEIKMAMEAYVQWLIQSGWSKRVSALFISYGITWEWALLGSDGFLDYSEHAQAYFRQWVQKKYETEEALSAAWGRKTHFEEIQIPSAERRARPGGPSRGRTGPRGQRGTPDEQDVIDHQASLSDMNVDVLLSLADVAKHASSGEAMVGSFYGYTLTAREQAPFTGLYGAGGFQGGHHALGRVLRSPNVDFLASPFSYANRDLGSGLLIEHVPLASLHAHGKAFFDENDLYPHTNQPDDDDRAKSISIGVARNLRESILYLRLAIMQAIVRGKHQWLTELTGWVGKMYDNFSDPQVRAEITHLNHLAESLIHLDRSPVAETAFVLDEFSVAHLTLDHTGFRDSVYKASTTWAHAGAPIDILLLEDLDSPSADRYRLVVPACLRSSDSIRFFEKWRKTHPETHVWWDGTPQWYPPDSSEALAREMKTAGVHRYIEDSVTVWANASMVGVHANHAGRHKIHFRTDCSGREIFSGKNFQAPQKTLEWDFETHGVALFIIDPA